MAEIKLNIALQLPATIARQAISQSRAAAKIGGAEFVLDGSHIIPHITLFMGYFPEEKLAQIQQAVENIALSHNAIVCTPTKPYARQGYVGLNVNCVGVETLRAKAELEIGKWCLRTSTMDESHITILKFKNTRATAPLLKLPPFTVTALAIYEAGKHGTCIRQLSSAPLNHQ